MNGEGRPAGRPTHRSDTAKYQIATTVTPEWERQRQIWRMAAIATLQAVYGADADLAPTPPGPTSCPPTCSYCRAVVA